MLRFAIAGCGQRAAHHAKIINKFGDLAVVCDVIKEKADSFAEYNGAKAYYTVDDLLQSEKKIDFIVICTPNGFHAEHIIKSLQAGIHVICEQPLCLTPAAAWQIMETEKFTRRKLFVVQALRYQTALQQLHDQIQSGKLGKVYSFSLNCFWQKDATYFEGWRGEQFPGGGSLYTPFSQYIDVLLWMMGDIDAVKGFSGNRSQERSIMFEDTGAVAIQMQSGTLGTFHWTVNGLDKDNKTELILVTEKGTVSISGMMLNNLNDQELSQDSESSGIRNPGEGLTEAAIMETLDNMYETLMAGQHLGGSTAFSGLKTVEAIDKIYKAVHSSRQV